MCAAGSISVNRIDFVCSVFHLKRIDIRNRHWQGRQKATKKWKQKQNGQKQNRNQERQKQSNANNKLIVSPTFSFYFLLFLTLSPAQLTTTNFSHNQNYVITTDIISYYCFFLLVASPNSLVFCWYSFTNIVPSTKYLIVWRHRCYRLDNIVSVERRHHNFRRWFMHFVDSQRKVSNKFNFKRLPTMGNMKSLNDYRFSATTLLFQLKNAIYHFPRNVTKTCAPFLPIEIGCARVVLLLLLLLHAPMEVFVIIKFEWNEFPVIKCQFLINQWDFVITICALDKPDELLRSCGFHRIRWTASGKSKLSAPTIVFIHQL